jgi:hypothetical protein
MNDTMPGRYRPQEAEVAWGMITDFLHRVFSGQLPADKVTWKLNSEVATDYDFKKNVRLA